MRCVRAAGGQTSDDSGDPGEGDEPEADAEEHAAHVRAQESVLKKIAPVLNANPKRQPG